MDTTIQLDYQRNGTLQTESAQAIPLSRIQGIFEYMERDAGMRSFFSIRLPTPWFAILIDEKSQSMEAGTGGCLGEVTLPTSEGNAQRIVASVRRDRYPEDENQTLVHETIGHMFFDAPLLQHVDEGKIDTADMKRSSEAFARTLTFFLTELNASILKDADTGEKQGTYVQGTHDLTERAFQVYTRVGKKGIVSVFQAMQADALNGKLEPGRTYIDDIVGDAKVMKDLAVIAAHDGGEHIGQMIQTGSTKAIHERAQAAYDKLVQEGKTEMDLFERYIANEFCLGKAFARVLVKSAKPSCFEEYVEKKKMKRIQRASHLKWIYAHAATDTPSVERGLRLLEHCISTISSTRELGGLSRYPRFQSKTLRHYAHYLGAGDALVDTVIRLNIPYQDMTSLYQVELVPLVVGLRKTIYGVRQLARKYFH